MAPPARDQQFEILDLPEEVRRLVAECELTGRRTTFSRNGRAAAILISHDEFMALRETIDIAADEPLRAQLAGGEDEAQKNQLMLLEDLTGRRAPNDRLRFVESLERAWPSLSGEEQTTVAAMLERIDEDPIAGAPLLEPFRGLWSDRSGHLRVVYRIVAEARFIVILHIGRAA